MGLLATMASCSDDVNEWMTPAEDGISCIYATIGDDMADTRTMLVNDREEYSGRQTTPLVLFLQEIFQRVGTNLCTRVTAVSIMMMYQSPQPVHILPLIHPCCLL